MKINGEGWTQLELLLLRLYLLLQLLIKLIVSILDQLHASGGKFAFS
jgi:hypothetical protein